VGEGGKSGVGMSVRLVYMLNHAYMFVCGEGGSLTREFVCFLPGEYIVLLCVGMCKL